jgi:hypothetical protein
MLNKAGIGDPRVLIPQKTLGHFSKPLEQSHLEQIKEN